MRKCTREPLSMSQGPASEAVLGGPGAPHGVQKRDLSDDFSLLDVSPVLCHAGASPKSEVYSALHWFLASQLKEGLVWLGASLHYFMSF